MGDIASAQRILNLRGRPPYREEQYPSGDEHGEALDCISSDELRIISEFVQFWLPFLVEKEKR